MSPMRRKLPKPHDARKGRLPPKLDDPHSEQCGGCNAPFQTGDWTMVFTSKPLCRGCSIQRLEAGVMPKGMTMFIHHTHTPPTKVSGEILDKVDRTQAFLFIAIGAPNPDEMLAFIRRWECYPQRTTDLVRALHSA